MKITLSILGSIGSVGLTVLNILNKKKNTFKINLLSANKNLKLISKQIKMYKPQYYIINNDLVYRKIKKRFKNKKIKILRNFSSIKNIKKSDFTITAIPGIAGLQPTLKMIKHTKKLLIANKESIVCGWNLIKNLSQKHKTKIIPIDSEHFSIFKIIEHHKPENIEKIYITASGGPFLNFKPYQLKNIKPEDALKHPKWKMGKKISIDSSTLMNKLFELIEAKKLFNIPINKLDILIHPESLVHAIVKFKNGLIRLIYHETSMIIPLSNAIFGENFEVKKFLPNKFKKKTIIKNLIFENVKKKIFPVYKLKEKLTAYPSTPIIINAVNEILVDQFLQKNIPFLSISSNILKILNDRNYKKYAIKRPKNINEIIKIDNWARTNIIKKL